MVKGKGGGGGKSSAPVGRPPKQTTAANAVARNQGHKYAISKEYKGTPNNAIVTLIPPGSSTPLPGTHSPTGAPPNFQTVNQHYPNK